MKRPIGIVASDGRTISSTDLFEGPRPAGSERVALQETLQRLLPAVEAIDGVNAAVCRSAGLAAARGRLAPALWARTRRRLDQRQRLIARPLVRSSAECADSGHQLRRLG